MNTLDIKTLYITYTLVNSVGLLMMFILWKQSRKRFEGTHFFVLDFLFQIVCLTLIFLRGQIPDFFSMVISITLSVTGTFMGLIGLSKFTGKKINYLINFLLIAEVFAVQFWFSIINENLSARNFNFSLVFMMLTVQCAWILLVNVPPKLKNLTIWVGIVFLLFALVNLVRIVVYFMIGTETNDYLNSGPFESGVILVYQILFSFLTFSLILMFNGRLNRQIAFEEEKFSKAFQLAPYAIVITRLADGKIYEANDGFVLLSGYTKTEAIGKTTNELNLYNESDDRDKVVQLLKAEGKFKNKELIYRRKTGELFFGLVSAELIEIDYETSILTTIYDLTQRKELENQLIEMNATKDKFFSIIAHDLKNPVSNVLGFSNLLNEELNSFDGNEIAQYVSLINTSAKQTLNLLDNLLQWSMMQQGKMLFEPKPLILSEITKDVIDIVNENVKLKQISVFNNVPEKLILTADENMLKTLLRNLIHNAVKFTNQGGKIEISASGQNNGVLISVADNGVGIDKNNLKKIFDIGSGYSTRGTHNEKGTGLGLILCKEFVEKHNGRIWVESEQGKGSNFHILLPVSSVEKT
ncbi:MAG: ATP-binding protein [Draconibacterium sp.]